MRWPSYVVSRCNDKPTTQCRPATHQCLQNNIRYESIKIRWLFKGFLDFNKDLTKRSAIDCKVLAHNLCVVIQEAHELNINVS